MGSGPAETCVSPGKQLLDAVILRNWRVMTRFGLDARITGPKPTAAVLAIDPLPQQSNADPQHPPTDRTPLMVVDRFAHLPFSRFVSRRPTMSGTLPTCDVVLILGWNSRSGENRHFHNLNAGHVNLSAITPPLAECTDFPSKFATASLERGANPRESSYPAGPAISRNDEIGDFLCRAASAIFFDLIKS